jgi:acid phosphatase
MMKKNTTKTRPRYLFILAGLLVVAVLAGAMYIRFAGWGDKNPASSGRASASASLAHIFVIVEENKLYNAVINGDQSSFITGLANKNALATNYSAITNPSLPNYIALTSGSTQGITTDCNPPRAGCIVDVQNIADEIEQSGRTWKVYAESMPAPCTMNNAGNFATKHVPFLYYADIANNADRCSSHIVPFSQLASDITSASTTPNFAFIVPDMCNDTHNCPLATGDAWLAQHVPTILQSKAFTSQPSLLVITWDEGNASDNHVVTIFAGSGAKDSFQSATPYNHYSLLRTIENAWQLSPLTQNDTNAKPMNDMLSSPQT